MRVYTIDERSSGTKLFNFAAKLLPEIRNSDMFKILRKGVITVNDKKADFSYRLVNGDEVVMHLAEEYFRAEHAKLQFPHYELDIVHEDRNILIINKPRGLLVHSDGREFKDNLVEYIKGYLYRKQAWDPSLPFTPTVCNRLDYNTSGLVVAAKTQDALKTITAQFRKRDTAKQYYTIVYGQLKEKLFIQSVIAQAPGEDNMMISSDTQLCRTIPDKDTFISENPQMSAMVVKPLFAGEDCTLCDIELWTGRKHQIRCQLKASGFPLIGDFKYFSPQSVKISNLLHADGYYLHSYYIELDTYGAWQSKPDTRFMEFIREVFGETGVFS